MKKIKTIFEDQKEMELKIKGWVISNRGNDKIRFLIINDGSTFKNLQVVLKDDIAEQHSNLRIGASVVVSGELKNTPNGKQELEMLGKDIIFKNSDEDFPLQKQGMSMKVLREIPHLRHRTNLLRAAFRIRSTIMLELHAFFDEKNFLNISTPILTGNDAEGAGEAFIVDSEEKNFFGKKASLGVSGQLHAEGYANGFGDVYTFSPAFRAENSHTQKHASEFWMLEPEMAFRSYIDAINFADEMLKTTIKNTMKRLPDEFEFLNTKIDSELISKLDKFINTKIKIIKYADAVEELKKVKDIFDIKDIEFGIDLATEHEKYLANELFKGPVAVIDYPKEIKAFYMKANDDMKTVKAFDILVPGIGELIGGSERETDINKLKLKLIDYDLDEKELKWYLDLRRFGQYQSSGFGLGFARLLMYITGIENIRDVIPYPRTPNNLKM